MENYFTFTKLLGLRDEEGSNLPVFKDARLQRIRSVERMMDLIEIANQTRPETPSNLLRLNPLDPQWDDQMPFPVIDRSKYFKYGVGISSLLVSQTLYSSSTAIIIASFRNVFPFLVGIIFADAYSSYRRQILKTNLFDEYCYLRSQELVKQNQYVLDHPNFKRFAWWYLDLKETLNKVYRQANDNKQSDFKDSELLLQDFINRYVDPSLPSPMKPFSQIVVPTM